jgi:K+:H+ antiporter
MTAFLLAVAVIFLGAAVCGNIAARLGLPRVVGEMAAGLILGQSLLAHLWPRAESYLFGDRVLVGAELDRSVLRGRGSHFTGAVAIGLGAAICGAAVIGSVLSDLEPAGVPTWTFFVFLTAALLVTAVPVLARILDETGLTRTRVGATTLTLSIADDFVAFTMIAIAIAIATGGSLALAVAGTITLLALALVGSKLSDGARRRLTGMPAPSAVGIAVFALVLAMAGSLGASMLVAAFLVGAVLWRPTGATVALPGGVLIRALVPLYIVYAALAVDVTRLAVTRLAFAVLLTTAIAILTKVAASLIAGRLMGLRRNETVSLAVLRNTRGLTELVALNLGYQAGLLSQDLYTVFFSMALLTTAASGAVAMAALRPLEKSGKLAFEACSDRPGRDERALETTPAV